MADFIGDHDKPLFSFNEIAAVFNALKANALVVQGLCYSEDDLAEQAFYGGAEWALIEAQTMIEAKLGLRPPHHDVWAEAI